MIVVLISEMGEGRQDFPNRKLIRGVHRQIGAPSVDEKPRTTFPGLSKVDIIIFAE
jgi:hypothetical protein